MAVTTLGTVTFPTHTNELKYQITASKKISKATLKSGTVLAKLVFSTCKLDLSYRVEQSDVLKTDLLAFRAANLTTGFTFTDAGGYAHTNCQFDGGIDFKPTKQDNEKAGNPALWDVSFSLFWDDFAESDTVPISDVIKVVYKGGNESAKVPMVSGKNIAGTRKTWIKGPKYDERGFSMDFVKCQIPQEIVQYWTAKLGTEMTIDFPQIGLFTGLVNSSKFSLTKKAGDVWSSNSLVIREN